MILRRLLILMQYLQLNDMALRDSATMCIKNILTYIAGIEDSPGPELVKLIVIDNLVPQIKTGITLESEVSVKNMFSRT